MILKMSEAANLAIHGLAFLAGRQTAQHVSAGEIAGALLVSEAHLIKVFQRLKKQGIVKSYRGPHGGFSLARDPATISLEEIYRAIDGPRLDGDCLLDRQQCGFGHCVFGDLMKSIRQQVDEYFSGTTLADVQRPA